MHDAFHLTFRAAMWTFNYPWDSIKSIIQTDTSPKHLRIRDVLVRTVREHGIRRGLFTVRIWTYVARQASTHAFFDVIGRLITENGYSI